MRKLTKKQKKEFLNDCEKALNNKKVLNEYNKILGFCNLFNEWLKYKNIECTYFGSVALQHKFEEFWYYIFRNRTTNSSQAYYFNNAKERLLIIQKFKDKNKY